MIANLIEVACIIIIILVVWILPVVILGRKKNIKDFPYQVITKHDKDSHLWEGSILNKADIKDFPFLVSIQDDKGRHFCGGSILNTRLILTAAHCTDGKKASQLTVRVGSTDRTAGGQLTNVIKYGQHPDYNNRSADNDCAFMELDEDLVFNENVQPIELWEGELPVGKHAWIAGWGGSKTLHKLQVPILSKKMCKSLYKEITAITYNMFCAGHVAADPTPVCRGGDSGSPIVVNGKQVGLLSKGPTEEWSVLPDVFTNMTTNAEPIQMFLNIN